MNTSFNFQIYFQIQFVNLISSFTIYRFNFQIQFLDLFLDLISRFPFYVDLISRFSFWINFLNLFSIFGFSQIYFQTFNIELLYRLPFRLLAQIYLTDLFTFCGSLVSIMYFLDLPLVLFDFLPAFIYFPDLLSRYTFKI